MDNIKKTPDKFPTADIRECWDTPPWGMWFDICGLIKQTDIRWKACGKWVLFFKAQKTPCWSTPPRHLPLKSHPTTTTTTNASPPPRPLWSRCIVGRKVVAIRPLRGLRGRSENPEIHYAFKTFIYFRITYILSPGGPSGAQKRRRSISFGKHIGYKHSILIGGGGILLRKWRF